MNLDGPVIPFRTRLKFGRWHGVLVWKHGPLAFSKRRLRSSRKSKNGRPTYHWQSILTEYLTPIPHQNGISISFPTIEDLSKKFGCSASYIRAKAAAGKWRQQRNLVEMNWWNARSEELNQNMRNRLVAIRSYSFSNAAKAIEKSASLLNGSPDSLALLRAVSATSSALEMAEKAVAGPKRSADPFDGQMGAAVEIPIPGGSAKMALWTSAQKLLSSGAAPPDLVDLSPPSLSPARE